MHNSATSCYISVQLQMIVLEKQVYEEFAKFCKQSFPQWITKCCSIFFFSFVHLNLTICCRSKYDLGAAKVKTIQMFHMHNILAYSLQLYFSTQFICSLFAAWILCEGTQILSIDSFLGARKTERDLWKLYLSFSKQWYMKNTRLWRWLYPFSSSGDPV